MVKRNPKSYDVVIVGSGPAGSLLAYALASAGGSILLLEKKKLPRYKACGGGLTQRAKALIPFDIDDLIEDQARTVRLRVDDQTIFSQTLSTPPVHLVMRDRLDHFLARRACAAGAVLQDRTRFLSLTGPPGNLTVQTTNGPIKTGYIVGADGVHSRVARMLALPIRYRTMPALEAELFVPPKHHRRLTGSIQFDFGVIPGGYAWLFPKQNQISAGILTRRNQAQDLKAHLIRYLDRNDLRVGTDIGSIRLHPIPCRTDRRNRYANERGLIVGDGTGLVDPVTGEGIYYALQSARLAADAFARHGNDRHSLSQRYNRLIKNEIEAESHKADTLARILYGCPALSNRILARFGDKIGAKHMAVYRGDMTYQQLYSYVFSPKGFAYLLRPRGTVNQAQ
jgi:geranylgeranyl reductase family protein